MKLLVEKDGVEEGKFLYTGWAIHHAKSKNGGYCGWMLFSGPNKVRTSDLNYHTARCAIVMKAGNADESDAKVGLDFFGRSPKTCLSGKDKASLNASVTNLILSTLRPYELANEPFLRDLILNAVNVGYRIGSGGVLRLDFDDESKLITGDGVRKNLGRVYEEITSYWAALLREAHDKGLTSFYTDIGKDKLNNRSMLNICVTVTFPAILGETFDIVLATKSYKSALLEAANNGGDVDLDDIADEVFSKNARNILASFKSSLQSFGVPASGDYYITADRASVNVAGFGKYFLCC